MIRQLAELLVSASVFVAGAYVGEQAQAQTANAEPARNSTAEQILVGAWFGEASIPGNPQMLQQVLTTRRADGTYALELRTYQDGKLRQRIVNNGVWGISNGLFTTLATQIDGNNTRVSDPSFTTVYVVRSLTPNEFRYQHLASGKDFRVVRATADFRLPD